MKKILTLSVVLVLIIASGLFYYQYQKNNPVSSQDKTLDQLANQTIQTKQISTNLNSENLIQVQFSIEMDSKKTLKQSEKIKPIIESDIIKILSKSNKDDFKDITAFEGKIKDKLNERFSDGKIKNVYTTELLIQ
ncbi:flagellar basal body-associated FliL family protein [Neobacillus rhizophilus]|uniref:Flagellar protein FliL n=1 Tax=Neobacillus rhizophilus TaxID=2833579 RepID=A0A942U541_9BACI|nr:flagellar basal body-associated FliL family protein [Neobacillus rhizophilus]MBS4213022.1 flagellar basal body-associated FliL family protein [Neobacillus rhizophilus]